ncbi:hypothetical protein Rhopal_003409-T1 [Rhodotorula paludigena]|uniref:RING-type domain-containing protein n=1 Tax=Rhodotorula paludigena TaxID=86838 RepID=A0AAV5GNY1_9BASI|nr:hypothetical protein Rhopal_003409-T1 [Rhodotorula paludigena]
MAPLVSPRPAAASLPGQRQPSPSISRSARPPESSGTTETYWGTIHLYREQGAEPSSMDEKRKAKEADDGRAVALVSVPGVLNAAALLEFIAPALDDVEQVRMLRDATPNRSIVLVRFRDAATADQFRRVFNGRPYHDSKDSEICHVVSLSSVKLKTTSTPPFTFPSLAPPSSDGSSPPVTHDSTTGRDLVELPTCPVCLDVLDTRASGLVQIMCQHSFHCTCLLRWRDSRCPVCRYTNARQRRNSSSDTSDAKYSLEIATGRIWSYLDERLIELPSFSTAAAATRGGPSTPDPDDLTAKIAQQGPDRSAEVEQDKLEALAVSYGDLMSSQLDSQREYYEGEVAREKDRVRMSERKRDELERDVARLSREAGEAERRARDERARAAKEREALEAQVELLRREAAREADERRKERAEAVRARKALERDLEAERAVTASLSSNLAALRGDMAQQQRDTAGVRNEVDELKDQINDLMAALTLRDRIEQAGPDSELAGASLGVAPNPQAQQDTVPRNPSAAKAAARRKKKK